MDHAVRLRQLSYFVEAARSGSLLRASERLHVSQPAITNGLRDLETTLGAKLLQRNRNGVELTGYGKVFIHHAINVLSEINAGVSHLQAVLKAERGQVTFGAPPIISFGLVPQVLARFKRDHPLVVVIANPANLDALLPSLRLAELDFIIAGIGTPEQMAGIQYEVLFHERLCLVARHGHPLAGKKRVTPKELQSCPWFILHPYRDFRDQVEYLFAAAGLEFPRNFIEAGHNIAADYLRQSDAVAILPYNLVGESIEAGSLIELPTERPLPGYPVGILRREAAELTATAQLFIAETKATAARLRPVPAAVTPPFRTRTATRRRKQV
ncbi:MAG TPA: LysR substrate-binding domain-containing protein [Stellaceae bacterium]|jgi:LysR family pca operon transcriptional activator|nr:LysR substrate-binding domain-containing protein [Stellaceae bacterium]